MAAQWSVGKILGGLLFMWKSHHFARNLVWSLAMVSDEGRTQCGNYAVEACHLNIASHSSLSVHGPWIKVMVPEKTWECPVLYWCWQSLCHFCSTIFHCWKSGLADDKENVTTNVTIIRNPGLLTMWSLGDKWFHPLPPKSLLLLASDIITPAKDHFEVFFFNICLYKPWDFVASKAKCTIQLLTYRHRYSCPTKIRYTRYHP